MKWMRSASGVVSLRRLLIWSLVLLAVGGAAGFFVFSPPGGGTEAPYRVATLDRGAITATVRATGTLNPVTTVLVGSQLSGQVVEVLADYNSPVRAGQVVARLYSEQIKTRRDAARADLAQAQADLAMRKAQLDRTRAGRLKAEANLRDQQAQRDRAVAQLDEARRAEARQTDLQGRGVSTPTALDAARTQTKVQEAALASAEAQIAALGAELRGLDADLANGEAQVQAAQAVILQRAAKLRDVEIDLDRTDIRSPVDGVVVQREVTLGQTVAASLNAPTLFTVAQDLRRIDIHANIDETDVGRLREGQPVTFSVNAHPNRTFRGTVRMVRLGAQTVQNVVTYTAVIAVDNRDMALLPGLTANLQIVVDDRGDALRVPNAALRFRPPGAPAATPPIGAAPAVAAEGPRGGGRSMQEMRERIAAEVGPTPEQAAEIERILAEARGSFPGRDPSLSPEERRAAFGRFRRELEERIAAALDPERRARFESVLAELRGGAGRDGGTPGRVFVLDRAGAPQPVAVRLGITDGAHTEVIGGDLAAGAAVVVGGGPRPQGAAQGPAPARRGPRLF
jgi:HlyD family secretion protein